MQQINQNATDTAKYTPAGQYGNGGTNTAYYHTQSNEQNNNYNTYDTYQGNYYNSDGGGTGTNTGSSGYNSGMFGCNNGNGNGHGGNQRITNPFGSHTQHIYDQYNNNNDNNKRKKQNNNMKNKQVKCIFL